MAPSSLALGPCSTSALLPVRAARPRLAAGSARATPRLRQQRGALLVASAGGYPADDMFRLMDSQMRMMDQQMFEMQRQMDRDMSSIFGEARRMEQRIDAEVERALQTAERQVEQAQSRAGVGPNVSIRRHEERGPGSYRYFESIHVTSGGGYYRPAAVLPPAASPLSAAAIGAAVVVTGLAALGAAFYRNYGLTTFAENRRWLLTLLWPLLFPFSSKFREEFATALRGEPRGKAARQAAGQGQPGGSEAGR